MTIKNIFWDVDGVLANLNYAYYNFLTKHPILKGSAVGEAILAH